MTLGTSHCCSKLGIALQKHPPTSQLGNTYLGVSSCSDNDLAAVWALPLLPRKKAIRQHINDSRIQHPVLHISVLCELQQHTTAPTQLENYSKKDEQEGLSGCDRGIRLCLKRLSTREHISWSKTFAYLTLPCTAELFVMGCWVLSPPTACQNPGPNLPRAHPPTVSMGLN